MAKTDWYHLYNVLLERSDEKNKLSLEKIQKLLQDEHGIRLSWKGFIGHLETLEALDYEVEKERKGRKDYYYIKERLFSTAELLVLMDGVYSNHSIPVCQSKKLIDKLLSFKSLYERSDLRRYMYYAGAVKYTNVEFLDNIGVINSAIADRRRIQFVYLTWTIQKNLVPLHNCDYLSVTPLIMVLDHERYYLVAWNESMNGIRHYRIDKIQDITILDEGASVDKKVLNAEPNDYARQHFGMFGGERKEVFLEGNPRKIGIVFDRFGVDIPVYETVEKRFRARVTAEVSRDFFGWIDGMEKDIIIAGPASVKEAYQNHLKKLLEK